LGSLEGNSTLRRQAGGITYVRHDLVETTSDTPRLIRKIDRCHKRFELDVNDTVDITKVQTEVSSDDRTDLESIFAIHYNRVARTIAFVIADRGRAEELAVEVFLRWSRSQANKGVNTEGWLYKTAANLAVDELRKRIRRTKFDRLFQSFRRPPTPEEILSANQDRDRVREVLSRMQPRQAELLVLRTQGLSYDELAALLSLNPASVGTLLSRAQQIFRKEYIAKYGPE
jgi:RNA polymerase sigma-70 factor (ECF subfamily)